MPAPPVTPLAYARSRSCPYIFSGWRANTHVLFSDPNTGWLGMQREEGKGKLAAGMRRPGDRTGERKESLYFTVHQL